MTGLCGTWLNKAIDFAVSCCKIPVRFMSDGKQYDMCIPFTITAWACYVTCMITKPTLLHSAAQKVLHYMLQDPKSVIKTWRSRMYSYSSGTYQKIAGEILDDWIASAKSEPRKKWLRRLDDHQKCFPQLADAIYKFINLKREPFPFAMQSQRSDFTCASTFTHVYPDSHMCNRIHTCAPTFTHMCNRIHTCATAFTHASL